MSDAPSDRPRPFRRKRASFSVDIGAIAKAAGGAINLLKEDDTFELPARLFEQLPFAH